MKLKIYRDKVISVVKGRGLVGVCVKIQVNHKEWEEILLAEMSPSKADKIIKLWNSK